MSVTQSKITRRGFLLRAAGGLAAVGATSAGYARWVEPFAVELKRLPLDLPNLHPAFHGLRIIQLADIHVGPGTPSGMTDAAAGAPPLSGAMIIAGAGLGGT